MSTEKNTKNKSQTSKGSDRDGKKFDNRSRNGHDDLAKKYSRPVRSEMQAKVREIIAELSTMNDQIKTHREEITKVNDATKGSRGEMDTAKSTMKSLQAERKVFMDQRASIVADRDALKAQVESIKASENKIKGDCKFKDVESCDKQIAEMEHRQSTTSLTLNEEKKLLKEMKVLQESKKCFSQLGGLKENMEKTKLSKTDLDKRYTEVMVLVEEVNGRMNKHRAVMDKLFGATSSQREHLPAIHKQIDELRASIAEKRKEVQTLESDFKKAEDEYFKKIKDERKKIEEDKKAELEAKKAEKEAKAKEAIEAELRKVPFEDEMKLCDSTVEYLDKKTKVYEAFLQLTSRTATPATSSSSTALSKGDGKVFKVLKREEPEVVTGRMSKKGKKSAMSLGTVASDNGTTTGSTTDDSITHDDTQTGVFSFFDIAAPAKVGDIASAVKALNDKKEFYQQQERGAAGVGTYNSFLKAQEKSAAKEAKEAEKEVVVEEATAPVQKVKSRKETVFTIDELHSANMFPSLGITASVEPELAVAQTSN